MINWCKNKSKINLVIDAVMLVLLMAIAGLGFLIKYVLVPGFKRNALYTSDVELYFMELTRHEWGSIHLWLSFVFLALIILHIIMHWKMITCIFKQMITGRASRAVIAVFIVIVTVFFALTPFYVKPQVTPFQVKQTRNYKIEQAMEEPDSTVKKGTLVSSTGNNRSGRLHKNRDEPRRSYSRDDLEIYGYMTLEEAARKYSLSITELAEALNIPPIQSSEKIGRLKKKYGFEMNYLKDIVLELNPN